MEPFRVTCETCRSRVKVRSADAIGQILACPKCGSMVQIAPPDDWTGDAVSALPVAATAVATDSMLSISSTVSEIEPADFNFDAPLEPSITPPATAEVAAPEAEAVASGVSPLVWLAIGGAAVFVANMARPTCLWPSGSRAADKPVPAVARVVATNAFNASGRRIRY